LTLTAQPAKPQHWRRIIHLLVFLSMLIPLLRPLGIPIPIGETSRAVYDYIQALGPADVLLVSSNFSVPQAPECLPQMTCVTLHALSRGAKIVVIASSADGARYATTVTELAVDEGARYGTDIVLLGFLPGEEAGVSAFLADVHRTFATDQEGTPLANLPLMQTVHTGSDFKGVSVTTASANDMDFWPRQLQKYGAALIMASQASSWPKLQPYLRSGQVTAGLNGQRDAAEYELLLHRPASSVAAMDATSGAYLLIVALVVASNVAYFVFERRKGR